MKKGLLIKLRNALLSLGEIITDKAVLVYDGELAVGTEVFVEDAEGNWVDAESGEYAAEDGRIIVVENGKVAEIREPEPEEQPVEEMPEEVEQEEEAPAEEAQDADKDAYIAELEARVAELEAENAELKAKLDEADVALKASAAQPAKEEFKNEKKEPLIVRRKFY